MDDLDCNEIIDGLWLGSAPPEGMCLSEAGFETVFLCAEEYQPEAEEFPGVEVKRYPLEDFVLNKRSKEITRSCANEVLETLASGKKVLVSCLAGHDRSATVVAYVLHLKFGWAGTKCIEHVQARRVDTLNKVQAKWLAKIKE